MPSLQAFIEACMLPLWEHMFWCSLLLRAGVYEQTNVFFKAMDKVL